MKNSGRPLDNQSWQTEWKTAPLAKVQLCGYENQTVEALVVAAIIMPSLIVQWPTIILIIIIIVIIIITAYTAAFPQSGSSSAGI